MWYQTLSDTSHDPIWNIFWYDPRFEMNYILMWNILWNELYSEMNMFWNKIYYSDIIILITFSMSYMHLILFL